MTTTPDPAVLARRWSAPCVCKHEKRVHGRFAEARGRGPCRHCGCTSFVPLVAVRSGGPRW